MPCYVIPCYTIPCYVTPCYAIPCYVILSSFGFEQFSQRCFRTCRILSGQDFPSLSSSRFPVQPAGLHLAYWVCEHHARLHAGQMPCFFLQGHCSSHWRRSWQETRGAVCVHRAGSNCKRLSSTGADTDILMHAFVIVLYHRYYSSLLLLFTQMSSPQVRHVQAWIAFLYGILSWQSAYQQRMVML